MSKWTVNEERVDIPYSSERRFACVEHPGRITNADRALETLGGNESVSKIYNKSVKRLGLSWRPEDIYCKPVYGDRIAVTNLLMKVKKRKRKSDGKVEYSIEIIGPIEVSYKFQGMCDFQYMPIKVLPEGTYEDISGKIMINSLNDRQEYLSRDVPLYIPPVAFSRVDRPCDFLYRQSIEHRGSYANPDLTRPPNLIGTVRQRRSLHTIFVNFGEAVPTTPIPEAVKKLKADFVDPDAEEIIKKLLEEKPIWLKVELEHRTGYRGEKLKTFLPALCFYWLDGPWRAQWNKFGYDPTKETSAKIYQTVDFRIRQAKPGQLQVKAKRTDFRINQWNMINRNQKHNVKIDLESLGENSKQKPKKNSVTTIEKELYYKFKPDKAPPHRMMYYPVCYVDIAEVQFLAHQNDGKETVCTDKDGWCIKDFNEKAREHMYSYLNRLLHQGLPVEMRFWRSKKIKRRTAMLRLDSDDEMTNEADQAKEQGNDIPETEDSNQQLEDDIKDASESEMDSATASNSNSTEQQDSVITEASDSNVEISSAIAEASDSNVEISSAIAEAGNSNAKIGSVIAEAGDSNAEIGSVIAETNDSSNVEKSNVIAEADDSNAEIGSVIAETSDRNVEKSSVIVEAGGSNIEIGSAITNAGDSKTDIDSAMIDASDTQEQSESFVAGDNNKEQTKTG